MTSVKLEASAACGSARRKAQRKEVHMDQVNTPSQPFQS